MEKEKEYPVSVEEMPIEKFAKMPEVVAAAGSVAIVRNDGVVPPVNFKEEPAPSAAKKMKGPGGR